MCKTRMRTDLCETYPNTFLVLRLFLQAYLSYTDIDKTSWYFYFYRSIHFCKTTQKKYPIHFLKELCHMTVLSLWLQWHELLVGVCSSLWSSLVKNPSVFKDMVHIIAVARISEGYRNCRSEQDFALNCSQTVENQLAVISIIQKGF